MQILLPVERLDRFEELQPNFKGMLDEKGRYLPGFDLKTGWRHSENQMMVGNGLIFCNLPLEANLVNSK